MNKIFLGLGSNVGDRFENISKAINFFKWDTRFNNVETSSIYQTKPYGDIEQDDFYNCVISLETNLNWDVIFKISKELEKKIGRKQRESWGPREIDIDILLFGNEIIENDTLTIPHKDLVNRDFVLTPLVELDEELEHPVLKKKMKLFLSDLKDKYIVNKINIDLKAQIS